MLQKLVCSKPKSEASAANDHITTDGTVSGILK
ncbi:Protein of unknown function [Bacillus cytotoxicus]|nr:Protein of unknown function [Bacillus cytotoxicus]